MSQIKVTLKELQEKCKSYGLKTYGKKEVLQTRIEKYLSENAVLAEKKNESNSSLNLALDNDIDDEDDDFDDDYHEIEEEINEEDIIDVNIIMHDSEKSFTQNTSRTSECDSSYKRIDKNSKKRTRVVSIFSLFNTYDNKDLAQAVIREENIWNKERMKERNTKSK
jgi:CRISPR/Cas system-associated endonuclease Cas3-HD